MTGVNIRRLAMLLMAVLLITGMLGACAQRNQNPAVITDAVSSATSDTTTDALKDAENKSSADTMAQTGDSTESTLPAQLETPSMPLMPSTLSPTQTEAPESTSATAKYPLTITDSNGITLRFEQAPEKVISIAPEITEILFALDLQSRMVGRTTYCTYPAETENIPVIGDTQLLDFEKVVAADPDLIFVSGMLTDENYRKLEGLNIKIAQFTGKDTLESIYENIIRIAKIFGEHEKGKALTEDITARIENVSNKTAALEKPSVYYVVSFGQYGDYTATGETFINKMIEFAGGDNVAKDTQGWLYSLEKLISDDPDIILCGPYMIEEFKTTPGYRELRAVKEGRVYEINEDALARQGPRVADSVIELAGIFHPDIAF